MPAGFSIKPNCYAATILGGLNHTVTFNGRATYCMIEVTATLPVTVRLNSDTGAEFQMDTATGAMEFPPGAMTVDNIYFGNGASGAGTATILVITGEPT